MHVMYEWDVETSEDGEIVDHDFSDTCPGLPASPNEQLVLVCESYFDKGWAYVTDGGLPDFFLDAYDSPMRRVPKRFHKELASVTRRSRLWK